MMPDAQRSPWATEQDTVGFTAESNQDLTCGESEAMATELRDSTVGLVPKISSPGASRNTCMHSPRRSQQWAGTSHRSGITRNGMDCSPGC